MIDAWWTRSPEGQATALEPGPEVDARPAPDPPGPTMQLTRRRMRQIAQLRQARADRPAPPARRRWLVPTLVAAALATGSAAAGVLALRPAPVRPQDTARTPRVVPVDPAAVSATASSTQTPDGDITYTAANTLDGDPTTAWNSNGKRDGKGPGISLTYTFAAPVVLHDITVRNGYQKVRPRAGRDPLDLFPVNSRVHRLRVVTDAGSWFWNLADARRAQTFAGAAGRTASVRLEIVSVYPSTTYPDVALSEVAFTASLDR